MVSVMSTGWSMRGGAGARSCWWIVLALLSATAVTLALGLWLLPVYGLINVGGVWALRRDLGTRRRGLQLLLSVGAILLVPVGVLGPLFSRGGPSPSEAASSA